MPLDKFSPDVAHLNRQIDDEIETKRNALERPDKDAVATALLRGYIKGVRAVRTMINGDPDDNDPDS